MPLLDPGLAQRLRALTLASRRRVTGGAGGARRSTRRGRSQEFADHRPYVPGDDLRFLDWHLYGRLDALWVKLFEDEQDRTVHLLVDTSASMEGDKLRYAREVAAALTFVALGGSDRVAVAGLSDRLADYAPARRGRGATHAVFRTLEGLMADGATDLSRAIASWPRQRGSGIGLLFTDFLFSQGVEAPLRRLRARGLELHALHVLSPVDVRPDLSGDLLLVDRETGEEVPVSVDDGVLDRYQQAVRAWADDVEQTCRRLGVGYSRVLTTTPVETLVLRDLRRAGLLA